ncbi:MULTISPECIES: VIT1/CCC1 transporter family protein [Aminobacterium]|nr:MULTISPECIES: VIT1/CCC1 transporter family protein [Aminobacterium]
MTSPDDLKRYKRNLIEELEAAELYEIMAAHEKNKALIEIYKRLAETERNHASKWITRIEEAGGVVPVFKRSWRLRTYTFLSKIFGTSFILPAVAAIESRAGSSYSEQNDSLAQSMAVQERSHSRIFRVLSREGKGLEGGAVARLEGRHPATGGNALRAAVLGANDGLVSNLSLVMGVAGAEMSAHSILITGLAGLLAGAISMALGEWLSVQSSRELYEHQISIEKEELEESPEEEMEELALIYQAKGIAPEKAHQMAYHMISDPNTALDTLAREELGIDPEELGGSAWEAAITSFLLFSLGAVFPVFPFFFIEGLPAVATSALLSTVGLFLVGAGITLVTGKSLLFSGLRQIFFGLSAAGVTYVIGRLIGVGLGG